MTGFRHKGYNCGNKIQFGLIRREVKIAFLCKFVRLQYRNILHFLEIGVAEGLKAEL